MLRGAAGSASTMGHRQQLVGVETRSDAGFLFPFSGGGSFIVKANNGWMFSVWCEPFLAAL